MENIIKPIKFILQLSILLFVANISMAQSGVKLNKFTVTNHFTEGPDINRISVSIEITGIDSLLSLQIEACEKDDFQQAQTKYFNLLLVHKDNMHYIQFGKDDLLPVSGKPSMFFLLEVRDQFRYPYYFFKVTGVDINGNKTNTLKYRKN